MILNCTNRGRHCRRVLPLKLCKQRICLTLATGLPYALTFLGDGNHLLHRKAWSAATRWLVTHFGSGSRFRFSSKPNNVDEQGTFHAHALAPPIEPHSLCPGGRQNATFSHKHRLRLKPSQCDLAPGNPSTEISKQLRPGRLKPLSPCALEGMQVESRHPCIHPLVLGIPVASPDLVGDSAPHPGRFVTVHEQLVAPGEQCRLQGERSINFVVQVGCFGIEGRRDSPPATSVPSHPVSGEPKVIGFHIGRRDAFRRLLVTSGCRDAGKCDPVGHDTAAEVGHETVPGVPEALLNPLDLSKINVGLIPNGRHCSSETARAGGIDLILAEFRLGGTDRLDQYRIAPAQEHVAKRNPFPLPRSRHPTTPCSWSQLDQAVDAGASVGLLSTAPVGAP